ncbi:GNAT family N-acetyltransferase [Robiginitalea sediminis]|uniref:GNAT family N-acetyltransferase n=1 Tax=Robiginitalea sediminis TaxID=1982593 RepID=UPI000B4A8A84|nr:GNAT family N-acetyltransferase [Robiginitalea sediminis]
MIRKLDHHKPDTARAIREVFQASYAVEARLLGATDFPPLKRPLEGFTTSSNDFYGFFRSGALAGVVEVVPGTNSTHIQSLVVLPRFFRKGIGKALVQFVLDTYVTSRYTVETGLKNLPATALYLRCGFRESGQYDTDHGVRKIRFERQRDPSP